MVLPEWSAADLGGNDVRMIVIFLVALFFISGHDAAADVYKYVSTDGVECYTDAPVNRKAVLMLRETRSSARKRKEITSPITSVSKPAPPPSLSKARSCDLRPRALPVSGIISSSVGLRMDPIDGLLRNHNGVDIAVPEGTPVKPVASGVVTYSGCRNGYGNMVIVEHDNGMITLYAHNRVNLAATGQRVESNGAIALTGSTGRSTGPHLHFEAWLDGENITAEFLEGVPESGRRSFSRASGRKKDIIRKMVMADGTILLTNLPLIHP
jgi:murein DD-endopeptidase MepM/ murein hydrolase activator NlpD